jgi:hypothetical protein
MIEPLLVRIEITKDDRGNYNVRIVDICDTLYDSAGFASPKDALDWAKEFMVYLGPMP